MNASKKINVNFSSLVGLKAELLRKQTEVTAAKEKAKATFTVHKPKRKVKKLKNDADKNTSESTEIEDVNTLKKSRLMLEAKARLYERLKKSKNTNENFLVDFKNKSDESEDEFPTETDYSNETVDPEDEWVEYEDCFGRTRKCLQKDLPAMQRKDDLLKQQIVKMKNDDSAETSNNDKHTVIQEKEPEIEVMRRKWEEQTEKLAEKVNIHYQDVLFDEARAHGVGYYAFSQDEEERAKQQENLATLRKQTEQRQKEMKELRELKEKMERNRLHAARIRQRVRAGLPIEPLEEEIQQDKSESEDKNEKQIEDKEEELNAPKDKSKDTSIKESPVVVEDKIKALGELLGKRTHWREMSQEEWVHKRRKDRVTEFAPTYDNFRSTGFLKFQNNSTITDKNDSKNRSHSDGYECLNKSNTSDTVSTCFISSMMKTKQNNSNDMDSYNIDDSDIGPVPIPQSGSNSTTQEIVNPNHTVLEKNESSEASLSFSATTHTQNKTVEKDVHTDTDDRCNRNSQPSSTEHTIKSLNEESITAGLKYLRAQFENNKYN